MIRLIIFNALLFGACGYALIKGRTDARIVGAVCILANFATFAVVSRYAHVETGVLVIDLLTFAAFTYVALMSDRFWPLWVSGLQLTTSMGHLFKAIQGDLLPLAYAAALRFWSYPILIILAIAVWRSEQRARHEKEAFPT
jgi:4-amino-4-deoxy-L-arabinose transferase-like glycosyltransferase